MVYLYRVNLLLMAYHVYRIESLPATRDILIALLAEAGMEAFEETEAGLDAYAAPGQQDWSHVLDRLQQTHSFVYTMEVLPEVNWNARWEREFKPISIGDRLHLRASFHPGRPGVAHDLVIDPKMAFGTGHHETTYLMCERLLERYGVPTHLGERVLDYGSGTGVLAILAARLGAGEVDAIDIEPAAYGSTLENAALNGVKLHRVACGELADLAVGKPYDLVLANINRNVLLENAVALYGRLRPGGTALLSGVLERDAERLREHWRAVGFEHQRTYRRADWCAFVFERD